MSDIKIRCPKCNWEPKSDDTWKYSCEHHWNTFSTAGRCPQCGKIWKDTQCFGPPVGCARWSPHLDWYDGLDDVIKELMEEIERSWELVEHEQQKTAR